MSKIFWGLILLSIIAGLFLGAVMSRASNAEAPEPNSAEAAIVNPPLGPPYSEPIKKVVPVKKITVASTPLVASRKIDSNTLAAWLEKQNSPLAQYSDQLLSSDYWSLIIGICYIEQYHCSKAPSNNYWGMMKSGGGLMKFTNLSEAITYMDNYFVKLSTRKSTVESLRGYYCASACTNWEPTVKRIKAELESL